MTPHRTQVCVAYVAPTNSYWASGRFGRLNVVDPRAPANITPYVKEVGKELRGGWQSSDMCKHVWTYVSVWRLDF